MTDESKLIVKGDIVVDKRDQGDYRATEFLVVNDPFTHEGVDYLTLENRNTGDLDVHDIDEYVKKRPLELSYQVIEDFRFALAELVKFAGEVSCKSVMPMDHWRSLMRCLSFARTVMEHYRHLGKAPIPFKRSWRPMDTASRKPGPPIRLMARAEGATAEIEVIGHFIDGDWYNVIFGDSGGRMTRLIPSGWLPLNRDEEFDDLYHLVMQGMTRPDQEPVFISRFFDPFSGGIPVSYPPEETST